MRRVLPVFLLLLFAGSAAAVPSDAPVPPLPARWITDTAGLITPGARLAIDAQLEAHEQKTGHQIVVWIGKTLDGYPLDDWATKTFAAWKPGRKGTDDGIALFVLAEDRTVAIEVGYGLEALVTDARASRIIDEEMVPRLRAGDADGAVSAAVDRLIEATGGDPAHRAQPPPPPGARGGGGGGPGSLVLIVIVIMAAALLFKRSPFMALYLLSNVFGRGFGGGGGGFGGGVGGGGFGGGGGRSGGGGARGSW